MFVDSNIILDVASRDPIWREWSSQQLGHFSASHNLMVNAIIVAEIAPAMRELGFLKSTLAQMTIEIVDMSPEVGFRAGIAHNDYRKNGGIRTSILADFLIGAHASVIGVPILTRDPKKYRTYFPTLEVIAPSHDPRH